MLTTTPPWPRRVRPFDTENDAIADARKYDYARAFNGWRPLYVEQRDDGRWWVMNPGYAVAFTPIPRRELIPKEHA